ncbi:uncharacterized protein LOC134265673 [Saccostrea cucullata]|uniref:uncharacterized protein LOC134265673 n=1 Tax=Saccostrea cuccullata TaxID=36930 RepID=UPI002ED3C074
MLGNVLSGPAWDSFVPSNCFANYTFYDTEDFSICLKYYSEFRTYEKARQNCQDEGGDLVKIDSKRKYEIYKMYLEPFRAFGEFITWVQAVLESGTWKFHDGTSIPMEGVCEIQNSNNPGENNMRTKSKNGFICSDMPGSVENGYVSHCPSTYVMYDYTHYNICLRYLSISANYTEAVGNCQADGGDLVKIDSSHKYDILKGHIGRFAADDSSQMWVQGVEINDRWIFHDGTLMPNICPLFESNASGEIHLTSYVYYNFSCYDSSPSSEHHYVCEIYRVFP